MYDEEYIGDSARTFGQILKDHLRTLSSIHGHANTTGHQNSMDNFTIMERESHNLPKAIKETIYIKINDQSLNRNIGEDKLLHV